MPEHAVALPILPARDLDESVAFWSRVPQLTVEKHEGGGYAFVQHRGEEVLHLAHVPDLDVAGNRAGCYLHVAEVDRLRDELVAAGLPVSAARDEPWGMRELRLEDPSGNVLRAGCVRDLAGR